jgi:hypothetical protein
VLIPKVTERRTLDLVVNGKPWTEEQLQIVYTAYGPGGHEDCIEIGPLWGLGRDNSDKGSNKALTQAYKYALVQVFQIGDSKSDGDSESAQADAHGKTPEERDWFKDHGWMSQEQHDTWHADRKKLARERGAAAKEWCDTNGLSFTRPVPHDLADSFDAFLASLRQPPAQQQYAPGEEPF